MVEELLNRKPVLGRTYHLVRWQRQGDGASADDSDSWKPEARLANCPPEPESR